MSRPFDPRTKILSLLCISALLFACSGDTGPIGPAGATGSPGSTGSPGPAGPSGGTVAAIVPIQTVEKINVSFDSVTIGAGGQAPEIVMRLTDDLGFGITGLPAASVGFTLAQLSPGQNGGSSEWQSYITRSSAGIENAQATTESASSGTFTPNGDGTYSYVFAQNLADYAAGPVFDANKIHRLGVEIRTNRDGFLPENIPANNAPFDFVPAGGSPADLEQRLIVDNSACNACHDNLELHGEARFDVAYCVTCHNPYSIDGETADEPWGGSVDMKVMIHKIHGNDNYGHKLTYGYRVVGFGGREHDFSDVVFPQDVRNCTTCHQESNDAVPQASNWRTVQNRAACGTCHDHIDWEGGTHPGGFVFTDDTLCVECHDDGAPATTAKLRVSEAHQIPEVEAAKAFRYEVVSVTGTAPGQMPTVSIRVVNPETGTAYDINDPAGPFQASRARLRVDISWTTGELGNLDPNDDLGRSATSGAPFAPIAIDFTSGATGDVDNVFTKTAAEAIPTGVTGSGVAILEGRPRVDLGDGLTSLAVVADGLSFAITDTSAQDRRQVVDIAKCNDCHKTLALHGDNRVGNTELCSTCHNPNATDIAQRGVADTDCDTLLGNDDEPIDFKRMVHRIHSGNAAVCGYNNSAHDYTGVVYPGRLNNCEGCHLAGTYYPVDPAAVLATTVDAGDDRSTLTDDVAISPNSSVCSSCHTSDLARNHMIQNGGDFAAGKDDTGAIISSGSETCALCHGEGRQADVREVHRIDTFEFN